MNEIDETGGWAIVELMGHKVVAGLASKSEMFGQPLLRIDVPATEGYPAFTQCYGVSAIYAITFVSEEVAKTTAQHVSLNPVSVYVPELITREKYENDVMDLRDRIKELQSRLNNAHQLPAGEDDDDDDVIDTAKFPGDF
jgi:hypothetical protein